MTPDPEHDVMVYRVGMVDAISGVPLGDRWTVWLGRDSEGAFDSEGDAVATALQLAGDEGRPAWLVQEGGTATQL